MSNQIFGYVEYQCLRCSDPQDAPIHDIASRKWEHDYLPELVNPDDAPQEIRRLNNAGNLYLDGGKTREAIACFVRAGMLGALHNERA